MTLTVAILSLLTSYNHIFLILVSLELIMVGISLRILFEGTIFWLFVFVPVAILTSALGLCLMFLSASSPGIHHLSMKHMMTW